MTNTDIAVVGAGPYGLSIAACLRRLGLNFRIFGQPMAAWQNMPQGMKLKSDGFASNLYDPDRSLTLERYCADHGIAYAHIGIPVALDTFINYGRAFQRKFVPNLETREVTAIERTPQGFRLRLDCGESFLAQRVVVAVGLTGFAQTPAVLSGLPKELISHSSQCANLARFARRRIAIIGAGASALEIASLLRGHGAEVTLIARAPAIHFHEPPRHRTFLDHLRAPYTMLGPGWKNLLCTQGPLLFRHMPESFRIRVVKTHPPPSAGWFAREGFDSQVRVLLSSEVTHAQVVGEDVQLNVSQKRGAPLRISVDHVIAATGYKADLRRVGFLDERIVSEIKCTDLAPALTADFESSVRGLYFVGAAAANTFGPVPRFVFGSEFSARRVSQHLNSVLTGRSSAYMSDRNEPVARPSETELHQAKTEHLEELKKSSRLRAS